MSNNHNLMGRIGRQLFSVDGSELCQLFPQWLSVPSQSQQDVELRWFEVLKIAIRINCGLVYFS